jgi:FlaA1/EpsC-like NDP-sugar epimerase
MMLDKFRKPIMFCVDLLLINMSVYLAFMIRYDWQLVQPALSSCLFFMFWATVIRISLFVIFGLYEWSFRYASVSEAVNILRAVTIGSLLLIATAFFAERTSMGRSVLLIDYLICIFLVGVSRFLPRVIIKFQHSRHKNLKRVLIVGAGAGGEMVARELIHAKTRIYQPVGFVDDSPARMNVRIHGVRVLGKTDDIKSIVENNNIEEIVIAIPSANGQTIRNIISKCEKTEVKIKTIPEFQKILTGEVTIKQLRDVRPEDLLGRDTVTIDTKDVGHFIRDKVVLVTGAGGTIGSELTRQIIKFDPKLLVLWDYNENDTYFLKLELEDKYPYIKTQILIGDVRDVGLLKYAFTKFKPRIVFHSAAHKHVPLMEDNPVSAVKNNILGTRNLMYAAEHYGVESFVMISTDKAVNPTSVMGASKRIAEMIVQSRAKTSRTKFMAVRFGNVIGSSGSVVPIFKQQIEKGGPLTVTHPEVKRFFMTASEAAQLVIQAGAIGKGGELFILDMGEQVKILDLAKNLVTLSGLDPNKDIEIKFTGLRPGEKLYEETLLDTEHDRATKHDKIYVAQPNNFNSHQLRKDVKELERLANWMEEEKIVEKMKKMIPDYSSNKNSKNG